MRVKELLQELQILGMGDCPVVFNAFPLKNLPTFSVAGMRLINRDGKIILELVPH